MSNRLRISIILLLLICAFLLVRQAKKKKVDIRYILSWMLLIFVLFILTLLPNTLEILTLALGITLPINMLFFFGSVLMLVIIYSLTISVTKLNDEVKELAQKLAIIEKKTRDTTEKDNENE